MLLVMPLSDRTMNAGSKNAGSKYWRFIRLSASGHRHVEEWADAKDWFTTIFASKDNLADAAIQRSLWAMVQQRQGSERTQSILCFRCFISHCVEQTCRQLTAQFGGEHGFRLNDLLPYVLDDDGSPWDWDAMDTLYPSVAVHAMRSFDPSKASMSTWVNRLVKHHRELNRFLLQQGLYLVSDWAILNDTKPTQLQHILGEFHLLALKEIQNYTALLQSYHQVYRRDRLQQRLSGTAGSGRSACLPPTPEQLTRMATILHTGFSRAWSPKTIASELLALAAYLRSYRIHVRSGQFSTESIDTTDAPLLEASVPTDDADTDAQVFLTQFRQQFLDSLDEALAQVVGDRLTAMGKRKHSSPDRFLEGLHLFHCVGQSMGDIATRLGLTAQYQVTRLLKLKEFRADVRQRLLVGLGDRLRSLAQQFSSPAQVRAMDAQLDAALAEQVDTLMTQAEAEASVAHQKPLKSLFAERLCRHLNTRRGGSW
jgi:hypothetical protein